MGVLLRLDRVEPGVLRRDRVYAPYELMSPDDDRPAATFGRRIQWLRRDRGVTQRDLASRVGINFTYLSKLENDRGEAPGEATVRKLAVELNADVEELLALAGKVPGALHERAQEDLAFALFLRRLPNASDKELQSFYSRMKIKPPKT